MSGKAVVIGLSDHHQSLWQFLQPKHSRTSSARYIFAWDLSTCGFYFLDGVSLCNPGWPGTYNPPASTSWVLGLQVNATMPCLHLLLKSSQVDPDVKSGLKPCVCWDRCHQAYKALGGRVFLKSSLQVRISHKLPSDVEAAQPQTTRGGSRGERNEIHFEPWACETKRVCFLAEWNS
jgi:hypothetical protein